MPISLNRLPNAALDRNFRNKTNENWDKLEKTHNDIEVVSEQAIVNSTVAKEKAIEANDLSQSVQNQLDTIVINDGQSDAEVLQARVDEKGFAYLNIKERIDAEQIKINNLGERVADIATNIKILGATGDGITNDTQAILNANNLGKEIYFPEGTYIFKAANINLLKGTVFRGAGAGKTIILVDVADAPYVFKTNLFTGFENIRIKFKNIFTGDAILHDPGYISKSNNGTYHHEKNISIKNVEITFPEYSGCGNGLTIRVRNYDDLGNTYDANIRNYLVYFYLDNLEVREGNKAINISIDQKNPVANQVWMTATKFKKIRSNKCVYGLFMSTSNASSSSLLDISDINFDDFIIQCVPANYFTSTTAPTTPIYIKGLSDRKILCAFNKLAIWDSSTGISGYLEQCNVKIYNYYLGYSYIMAPGYKRGFQIVNASLDADADLSRLRTTDITTGNESEIKFMDGGIKFYNNPTGENGYIARGQLYEKPIPGTNYSNVHLEAYDKNDEVEASIQLGYGTGFKGVKQGIVNINGKSNDGVMRQVVTMGSEGTVYNAASSEQGYYAGNGMYTKTEKTTITVPPTSSYVSVDIPIKEKYDFYPFVMNCHIETVMGGYSGDPSDVFVRNYAVTAPNNVRVVLKHNKATNIDLQIAIVICGYKTFTTVAKG
ncbi:glycosyl hydrolase family 28-related protein [Bacillus mobilis]|uniref:Glycosyl hydrolase family 28-related protein n=1 Tax=Bacillus mobilis TaxID=2026190 RepID=A0ABV4S4M4_9BACI